MNTPIKIFKARPTLEGAGVRLMRVFANPEVPLFDPFLLLDDFHSNDPADYLAGFPWHPHRGIETVTYMLHGRVEHEDSLGNSGVIRSGDVQWMTAGSGIIHSEMPKQNGSLLRGLQLWVNLPASHKMMPPRYRDITAAQVPAVKLGGGVLVRVICGEFEGVRGPARDIVIDPEYLDITLPAGAAYHRSAKPGYTVFAYILEGVVHLGGDMKNPVVQEHCALFPGGEELELAASEGGTRLLLVSGRPLGEPVAWQDPIVMNTHEELRAAFDEYRSGTFLKHG